nr:zinc finger, CCHC-type [Tanacetum cinerariifolium]
DKLNYLEQPIPPVPVAPAGQQVALEIFAAHTAWEEGQSVSSYVLKMKGYIDNLERLGHPMTLGLGVQKGNKHKKSHSQKGAKGQNQWKGKFAPKPKIPPPPKRENPAKESIYHECGEIGHWKRNCPKYLAELIKNKKNIALGVGGSGIFVIELNTILNRSWIYDTSCGTHICNTTQGLRASRKLKPGALSFNKRAKLDLDSALLWHYRLGHISKKCIEKLQHDGLLNSSDHTAFEKCVSCMSGKMARKAYTHQVERAKDLLGLIHTDQAEQELLRTTRDFHSCRQEERQSNYNMHSMGKTVNELHA